MFKNASIISALALLAAAAASPAQSAPAVAAKTAIVAEGSAVHDVRWRGHRHWRGGHWGHRHHRGIGLGIAGGVVAGALIAGAIREGRASDADMQACADRYRSFDPATGTYLSYDGNRYVCPYL